MILGSLVMRFANDFHSWLRHSWKLLANRLTRDPKIVIHGNSCIILYFIAQGLAESEKEKVSIVNRHQNHGSFSWHYGKLHLDTLGWIPWYFCLNIALECTQLNWYPLSTLNSKYYTDNKAGWYNVGPMPGGQYQCWANTHCGLGVIWQISQICNML